MLVCAQEQCVDVSAAVYNVVSPAEACTREDDSAAADGQHARGHGQGRVRGQAEEDRLPTGAAGVVSEAEGGLRAQSDARAPDG